MPTLSRDLVVQTTVVAKKGHPEQQSAVSICWIRHATGEDANVSPVIVVSRRMLSYVMLPSVHTEASFPLWGLKS